MKPPDDVPAAVIERDVDLDTRDGAREGGSDGGFAGIDPQ